MGNDMANLIATPCMALRPLHEEFVGTCPGCTLTEREFAALSPLEVVEHRGELYVVGLEAPGSRDPGAILAEVFWDVDAPDMVAEVSLRRGALLRAGILVEVEH
jgi:hypothetical protein